jgi:hypothetical protein
MRTVDLLERGLVAGRRATGERQLTVAIVGDELEASSH